MSSHEHDWVMIEIQEDFLEEGKTYIYECAICKGITTDTRPDLGSKSNLPA